jgi:Tol biopolymer transport system component
VTIERDDGPALDLAFDVGVPGPTMTADGGGVTQISTGSWNRYLLELGGEAPHDPHIEVWWRIGAVGNPCLDASGTGYHPRSVIDPGPRAAYDIVRSIPAFEVSPERPFPFAGATGLSVDITIDSEDWADCARGRDSLMLMSARKGYDAGHLWLPRDSVMRLATVDIAGQDLVIAVTAPTVADLDRANPVLETFSVEVRSTVATPGPQRSPRGPQPVPSSDPAGLVYRDDGRLHAIRPDGTGHEIVLDETARQIGVDGYVLSPDRRSIAFLSRDDAGTSVFVRDEDGELTLVAAVAAASSLTWSPDGDQLAFDASVDPTCTNIKSSDGVGAAIDRDSQWGRLTEGGGNDGAPCDVDIYVVSPGSLAVRVTASPERDTSPAWSPDGERIAFVSDQSGTDGDVYTMTPEGDDVTRVSTGGGFAPVWSPDGSRLAYFDAFLLPGGGASIVERRLIVAEADGSDPRVVAGPSAGAQLAWSPDGRSLAYTVWESRDPLRRRIYVVQVDGGDPRPLLAREATDASQFDPAWSPDGDSIAFTLASPGGRKWGTASVAVASVEDGSHVAVVDDGWQPAWR